MNSFPPEKYYEACITYHLVKEFEERFEKNSILLVLVRLKKKVKAMILDIHIQINLFLFNISDHLYIIVIIQSLAGRFAESN